MRSYLTTSEMEAHLGFKELFTYDTQLLNQEVSANSSPFWITV